MSEIKQIVNSEEAAQRKKKRNCQKKKPSNIEATLTNERTLDVDLIQEKRQIIGTHQDKFEIHSDVLQYISNLEMLVLKNRQKLQNERKLFTQILANVAHYFDHKGVSYQALDEYINSIAGQIQQDLELETEMKNFYKFIDQVKKPQQIAQVEKQQQIKEQTQQTQQNKVSKPKVANVLANSAPQQNVIKLQLNDTNNQIAITQQQQKIQNGEKRPEEKKKKKRPPTQQPDSLQQQQPQQLSNSNLSNNNEFSNAQAIPKKIIPTSGSHEGSNNTSMPQNIQNNIPQVHSNQIYQNQLKKVNPNPTSSEEPKPKKKRKKEESPVKALTNSGITMNPVKQEFQSQHLQQQQQQIYNQQQSQPLYSPQMHQYNNNQQRIQGQNIQHQPPQLQSHKVNQQQQQIAGFPQQQQQSQQQHNIMLAQSQQAQQQKLQLQQHQQQQQQFIMPNMTNASNIGDYHKLKEFFQQTTIDPKAIEMLSKNNQIDPKAYEMLSKLPNMNMGMYNFDNSSNNSNSKNNHTTQ